MKKPKEKILLVSPQVPEFDKMSGWIRLHLLVEMLARHYDVFYIAELAHQGYTGEDDKYTLFLKERGVRVFIGYQDFQEILLKNRFKLAIVVFFTPAERCLPIIRELQPDLNVVLDTVDVHFLRFQTKADLTKDPEDEKEAKQTKSRELDIYRRTEAIFTVTSLDKEILLEEDDSFIVDVIPNVHRVMFDESMLEKREKFKLLFVGGFGHPPNMDAVKYFCAEILPLVKKEHPSVEALIVGSSPPEEIRKLASDSVKIIGYVPEVEPYLRSSYISIAPLRYGAGMKGKIGEALAYGLPVVTTSVGAQGFALNHGEDIMIADTAQEFAESISRLISDRELYRRLSRSGPEYIRETCSPEVVEERLIEFVETSHRTLRQKQVARLGREQYGLKFDTFQKYRMAADAVEFLREDKPSILDVGSRGELIHFFPNDFVVSLSGDRPLITKTSLIGDRLALPFRDKSFDFVFALNGIEHLSERDRTNSLDELGRIASKGLILAAPFQKAANGERKALLNEFGNSDYVRECLLQSPPGGDSLPDMRKMTKHLEKAGFSISVLPNGYLPRWLFLSDFFGILIRIVGSDGVIRKWSEFQNRNYFHQSNREPCYRYLIVAARDASPPTLESLYAAPGREQFRDDLIETAINLPGMEMARLLQDKERTLIETREQLAQRDAYRDRLLFRGPLRIYRKLRSLLHKFQGLQSGSAEESR